MTNMRVYLGIFKRYNPRMGVNWEMHGLLYEYDRNNDLYGRGVYVGLVDEPENDFDGTWRDMFQGHYPEFANTRNAMEYWEGYTTLTQGILIDGAWDHGDEVNVMSLEMGSGPNAVPLLEAMRSLGVNAYIPCDWCGQPIEDMDDAQVSSWKGDGGVGIIPLAYQHTYCSEVERLLEMAQAVVDAEEKLREELTDLRRALRDSSHGYGYLVHPETGVKLWWNGTWHSERLIVTSGDGFNIGLEGHEVRSA